MCFRVVSKRRAPPPLLFFIPRQCQGRIQRGWENRLEPWQPRLQPSGQLAQPWPRWETWGGSHHERQGQRGRHRPVGSGYSGQNQHQKSERCKRKLLSLPGCCQRCRGDDKILLQSCWMSRPSTVSKWRFCNEKQLEMLQNLFIKARFFQQNKLCLSTGKRKDKK